MKHQLAHAFSLLLLALCMSLTPVQAELLATPLTGDTRLVQFPFDEDNTYLVLARPKAVTHLQFGPDESIVSIAAGDTAQWEITPTKNRKNLFLKPRFEALETSMTVITDRRSYQFVMRSNGDGKKWYQRVSWMYPSSLVLESDVVLDGKPPGALVPVPASSEAQAPVLISPTAPAPSGGLPTVSSGAVNADSLRFTYKVDGDTPFKPVQVFDDGKFTYLKMPPEVQELPALFAVVEGEQYALVNYTINGSYLVAQRLLEKAVLKLGKQEVKISRTKPATSWWSSRGAER